jgi:hypothetical protein
MQINDKNSILGLKNVISRLFEVKFDDFDDSKYHQDLPNALKELYEIEAFMAKENCSFETIRFFCNIDRLVCYKDLKLEEKSFVFLRENQNNWMCKTQLNSNEIFFEDAVEPKNSRILTTKIDTFLTTFALQEMAFSMKYYFGLENENIDEINDFFQKKENIWLEKEFIYSNPCSFYLVEEDCFVMFAGMNIFATNNEAKFHHYKSILKHYDF